MILRAYQKGCLFDAWNEYFDAGKWNEAFEEEGLSIDFYNTRERDFEEILPWDFIDCGVGKNFLKREYERAMAGIVTPDCRTRCSGCGASVFGGGVCVENKD